jgi:hypothetical protein
MVERGIRLRPGLQRVLLQDEDQRMSNSCRAYLNAARRRRRRCGLMNDERP